MDSHDGPGGEAIRQIRLRLGLTLREVEQLGRAVAERYGDPRYCLPVSHGKVVMEGQGDALREMVRGVVHEAMAEEVEALVGAGRYERREGRAGWRNGTRSRQWDTRVGTIELAVPRVRGEVGYFPSFLEYRRRSERALIAALVEMVLKGVSTRKAEHVLQVMGVEGISASQLSRFIGRLDEHVKAFREAPIDGEYPYVWLDAKYERVRSGGVVAHHAVLVAIGVRGDALQPATLVAELSPEAGSLVGKWAFEEHKLTYAGIMDIAGRLKSGSPGFMDASTVARH